MELLPPLKIPTPMVGVTCSLARMEGEVAEWLPTGEEKEKRPPELSVKILPDDLGSLLPQYKLQTLSSTNKKHCIILFILFSAIKF
jgi:hypothetical protein